VKTSAPGFGCIRPLHQSRSSFFVPPLAAATADRPPPALANMGFSSRCSVWQVRRTLGCGQHSAAVDCDTAGCHFAESRAVASDTAWLSSIPYHPKHGRQAATSGPPTHGKTKGCRR
jgi:hypothetical protein